MKEDEVNKINPFSESDSERIANEIVSKKSTRVCPFMKEYDVGKFVCSLYGVTGDYKVGACNFNKIEFMVSQIVPPNVGECYSPCPILNKVIKKIVKNWS